MQKAQEVRFLVDPRWKMAEDGKWKLGGMEDEGDVWAWKNPEDGTSAQNFVHPCHARNW